MTEKDQVYIVNAIKLGLATIHTHKGEDAIQKYIPKLESLLKQTTELEIIATLQDILETMRGELDEFAR